MDVLHDTQMFMEVEVVRNTLIYIVEECCTVNVSYTYFDCNIDMSFVGVL
jgi:hypothetical protein